MLDLARSPNAYRAMDHRAMVPDEVGPTLPQGFLGRDCREKEQCRTFFPAELPPKAGQAGADVDSRWKHHATACRHA